MTGVAVLGRPRAKIIGSYSEPGQLMEANPVRQLTANPTSSQCCVAGIVGRRWRDELTGALPGFERR